MIDPAQGADQFTTPGNGRRFVAAVFTITGITGSLSDDANNDATLIGSNGQTYTADFGGIAGYTNFNYGEYNVSAGETSVGAVTFQVPLTVKVTKIEWSANGGFAGTPAEWLIPAAATTAAVGTGPWAVIKTYYQDITLREYLAAWRLLGYHPRGSGYASFAAGYASTGRQTVRKISQSGDQVSFTLRSDNPDGTVQTYQGTATVTGGKIVTSDVVQTSGPAAAEAHCRTGRPSRSLASTANNGPSPASALYERVGQVLAIVPQRGKCSIVRWYRAPAACPWVVRLSASPLVRRRATPERPRGRVRLRLAQSLAATRG